MSADNWCICPKCKKMALAAKQKQIDKARASYGKLPPEEYEAILLASKEPINLGETLREDCKLYIREDGCFKVSYLAHCDRCGFQYKFNHVAWPDII